MCISPNNKRCWKAQLQLMPPSSPRFLTLDDEPLCKWESREKETRKLFGRKKELICSLHFLSLFLFGAFPGSSSPVPPPHTHNTHTHTHTDQHTTPHPSLYSTHTLGYAMCSSLEPPLIISSRFFASFSIITYFSINILQHMHFAPHNNMYKCI